MADPRTKQVVVDGTTYTVPFDAGPEDIMQAVKKETMPTAATPPTATEASSTMSKQEALAEFRRRLVLGRPRFGDATTDFIYPFSGDMPEVAEQLPARAINALVSIGETLLPQTPGEAAVDAVLTLLDPAAKVTKTLITKAPKILLPAAEMIADAVTSVAKGTRARGISGTATRIGVGAAAGMAGSALFGENPNEGALMGALQVVGGEAVSKILDWGNRGLIQPWLRKLQDPKIIGKVIDLINPILPEIRTAEDFQNVFLGAAGYLKTREAWDEGSRVLSNLLGEQRFTISAQKRLQTIRPLRDAYDLDQYNALTIEQLSGIIRDLGEMSYRKGEPIEGFSKKSIARLRDEVVEQTQTAIARADPVAANVFDARRRYEMKWRRLESLFAVRGIIENGEINMAVLQKELARRQRRMELATTAQELDQLLQAVYRGGPIGTLDVMPQMPGIRFAERGTKTPGLYLDLPQLPSYSGNPGYINPRFTSPGVPPALRAMFGEQQDENNQGGPPIPGSQ